MTDIITHVPFANRGISLPRFRFPQWGSSLGFGGVPRALGTAFSLAYVEPYNLSSQPQPSADDAHLQGRDPRW